MNKQTKTEQYQKAQELYKMEYAHFTDKYIPLIREFKPILKKGTLEEKITTLWLWLENDRFFVEDVEEWTKIAKAIEKEHGAPVAEWCALYYVNLDWLYNVRPYTRKAKESLYLITRFQTELKYIVQQKDIVTQIAKISNKISHTCNEEEKEIIKELYELYKGKEELFLTKKDYVEKQQEDLEELAARLMRGIKSSAVAFTEYYERLGFSNFMPTDLTEIIKELSSSYYKPVCIENKIFYDNVKPNKALITRTTKKIQENVKYLLDD